MESIRWRPGLPSDLMAPVTPPRGLTFDGLLLFLMTASIAASGFRALRIEIGTLMVHPYLVMVGILLPLMIVSRLLEFPTRILVALGAFSSLYFISTFSGGIALTEGVKTFAAASTVLVTALMVRSQNNFTAGVFGLILAVTFLAVWGVDADDLSATIGRSAIDVGNRNVFSLYALPAILLAVHELRMRRPHTLALRWLLFLCVVLTTVAVIISLNRSGWLGLALIGVMQLREQKLRGKWLIAFAIIASLGLAYYLYDSALIEERFLETFEQPGKDSVRWQLVSASWDIALSNPFFGVSPQLLPVELGSHLGWSSYIFPHNVFAHITAGCGFICLFSMVYVGVTMWTWRLEPEPPPQLQVEFVRSRKLLRMMLVLWVVRGMFTHEILYNPGFCIGLGLICGLCILNAPHMAFVKETQARAELPMPV